MSSEEKKPYRKRTTWGETIKVGTLFEKYKQKLRAPESSVVEAFCEVVEELLQITVKPETVTYTPATRTLALAAAGPLKSEVKLREGEIITHLKGRLGVKNAPQVIV